MRSICCQETILSSTPASDEQKARNGQWQLTVTRSPYRAAACVSSRREKSNKTPFFHVGDGGNTQTVIPEAIGAPRLRHFFIFFFFLMYNIGEERIRIRLADAVRKQWHSGVLQFRRNKSFTYKETLHHIECIPMELRYRRRRLPQAKDLFTGFIIDRKEPNRISNKPIPVESTTHRLLFTASHASPSQSRNDRNSELTGYIKRGCSWLFPSQLCVVFILRTSSFTHITKKKRDSRDKARGCKCL